VLFTETGNENKATGAAIRTQRRVDDLARKIMRGKIGRKQRRRWVWVYLGRWLELFQNLEIDEVCVMIIVLPPLLYVVG